MSASPPPRTEAYLLQSRANSFFTLADLELTDTNLRCTLKQSSGWVERELGLTDLKQQLADGQSVTAFEFRRDRLNIKWLKLYPSGIFTLSDAVLGRRAHRHWRQALAPAK
jgi:hypothetical protein